MGGREDFPQRSADRRSSGREGDRGWRWRDLFRAGPARHHRSCYLAVAKEFTQAARRAALLTLHPGGLKKCYLCCRIKVLPMSPVAQWGSSEEAPDACARAALPRLILLRCARAPLGKAQRRRRRRPHDPLLQQRDDLALGRRGAHFGAAVLDCHVEFAAHAEASRQINSRLDREAGAIDERAMVVGVERVEVGAGAMNLASDRVAGPMDELLTEAGALDHAAR